MSYKNKTTVSQSTIGRPAYEAIAAIAWLLACAVYLVLLATTNINTNLLLGAAFICFTFAALNMWRTARNWLQKARLVLGRPFMTSVESILRKQERKKMLFLGKGFQWEPWHAGMMHDVHSHTDEQVRHPPKWFKWVVAKTGSFLAEDATPECRYIHGCNQTEDDLHSPFPARRRHTLIVGTNGSGKTRFLENMVIQDSDRIEEPPNGETGRHGPIIIIDPKGDSELRDRAYAMSKLRGTESDFHYFCPSEPDISTRFDPLGSVTHATQIADSLKSLLPSDGEGEIFSSFAWRAVYAASWVIEQSGQHVSLVSLKAALTGGMDKLVVQALEQHLSDHNDRHAGWDSKVGTMQGRVKARTGAYGTDSKRASALVNYYENSVDVTDRNSDLMTLISLYKENPEHLRKLIAGIFPLLDKLTSGPLARLLSPGADSDDDRPFLSFQHVLDRSSVVYFNLEALKDGTTAQAVGSILISDLVRCAAKRQSRSRDYPPIHFYIDEAAEMMSAPFIQAMNKGRSVGIEMTVAAQTIPDFQAGLGSKAKSLQVLGNFNTVVCMRVRDHETIEYVEELCGSTVLHSRLKGRSTSNRAASDESSIGTDSVSITGQAENIPLVDRNLLTRLPPGEFFFSRSGGTLLKGRVLLVPLEDDERFEIPDLYDLLGPKS